MIFTVSGESGSGKTTAGNLLASKLNYKFFSGGYFFRKKAEEYNMDIIEFSNYAEKHPEIDIEQDKMIVDFMKKNDNIVLESRLSGVMACINNINAVKIYLNTELSTRIARLSNRDKGVTEQQIMARSRSEFLRYMIFYGLDYRVFSYYDYIIDTDHMLPDDIVNNIIDFYKKLK
ncbi:(d)CMP kinase [Ferroplasma sp.]|uniref:(d)CMP kinase n=1 Tax=Ferroplasma sp. TaxID=2591003 RepID=UPI00307D5D74